MQEEKILEALESIALTGPEAKEKVEDVFVLYDKLQERMGEPLGDRL